MIPRVFPSSLPLSGVVILEQDENILSHSELIAGTAIKSNAIAASSDHITCFICQYFISLIVRKDLRSCKIDFQGCRGTRRHIVINNKS
jgi:hypothetical protein